jgi:hypothetical protein
VLAVLLQEKCMVSMLVAQYVSRHRCRSAVVRCAQRLQQVLRWCVGECDRGSARGDLGQGDAG